MKKVLFMILAAVLIVGAGITGLVASANVAGTAEKTEENAAAESDPTPYVDPISGKLNYLTRQDLTDALDKAVELYFAKDERYLPKADDHSDYSYKSYVKEFLEIGEIEELLDADRDDFLHGCYSRYGSQFYRPILSCTIDLLIEKMDQSALSVNTASSYNTLSDFLSGVYPPNIIYFRATADLNGYANLNEYVSKLLRAEMNEQGRFGFSDKERIPVTVDRHVSDMFSIDCSSGSFSSCCWHTDGTVTERVYPSGHVGEVMKAMRAKYFDSLLDLWAEKGTWNEGVVSNVIVFENTVEGRNISTQKPS